MNSRQVNLQGFFAAILLALIISIAISGCGGGAGGGGTTGSAKDGTELGKLAAPTITPAGGSFQKAQNVVLSSNTFGATIYYTTDGSDPAVGSTVYSSPLSILQSANIKAKAVAPGYAESGISSASFQFSANTSFTTAMEVDPTTYQNVQYNGEAWYRISLLPGNFLRAQVTFSSGSPVLGLYDNNHSALSADLSGIGSSKTLSYNVSNGGYYYLSVSEAKGVRTYVNASGSRVPITYTIKFSTNPEGQVAAPLFSPTEGEYPFPLTVAITSSTQRANIYYTIDGSNPSTASWKYSQPVVLAAPGTMKAFAVKPGLSDSNVASVAYTAVINPTPTPTPNPTSSPGGGGGGGGGGTTGIIGNVHNVEGTGIPQASVSLDYQVRSGAAVKKPRGIVVTTVTDAQGNYAFYGISPGDYVVHAEHPEYLPNQEAVTAIQNQVVRRDITLYWKLAYNGKGSRLFGVWGTAAGEAFVCGTNGTLMRFSGGTWSDVFTGTASTLWSLWGSGNDDLLIASGPFGYSLFSTDHGITWNPRVSGVDDQFYSVWGSNDGGLILATTLYGKVYSSQDRGLTWQYKADISAYMTDYAHLWGYSDGNTFHLFIATDLGHILRSDGISDDVGVTWILKATLSDQKLHCVWGTANGSLILAGGSKTKASPGSGELAFSTNCGEFWTESTAFKGEPPTLDFDVYSICGKSDGTKIIITGVNYGEMQSVLLTNMTQVQANNNTSFTPVDQELNLFGGSWTLDGQNIFVVSEVGRILRSIDGGEEWNLDRQGEIGIIWDILGLSENEVYACGENGIVKSLNGNLWTRVSTLAVPESQATALTGIWGTADFMFACGYIYNGLYDIYYPGYPFYFTQLVQSFNGFNTFNIIPAWPIEPVNNYRFKDMWGFSNPESPYYSYTLSAGIKYGTPDKGLIGLTYLESEPFNYWNVLEMETFNDNTGVNRIWAAADDSFWLCVCNGGKIKRSTNGFVWTDIPSGTDKDLLSLWGTPDGTVIYAAGDGIVLKSTGKGDIGTWSKVESAPAEYFTGLWVRGDNDVYIGGLNLYHYDGTSWKQMYTSSETAGDTTVFSCLTIWGPSMGDKVYAGGIGGRIYEYEIEKSAAVKGVSRSTSRVVTKGATGIRKASEKLREAIKKKAVDQAAMERASSDGREAIKKVKKKRIIEERELLRRLKGRDSEISR